MVAEEKTGFDWTKAWPDLVTTPEAAAAQVRDGDLVGASLPEPTAFLYALAERTDLKDVAVFVPAPRKGGAAIAANANFELRAPFLTQILREAGATPNWCQCGSRIGGDSVNATHLALHVYKSELHCLTAQFPRGRP